MEKVNGYEQVARYPHPGSHWWAANLPIITIKWDEDMNIPKLALPTVIVIDIILMINGTKEGDRTPSNNHP